MGGHRDITGSDIHAQLEAFGPPGADVAAMRRAVPAGRGVASLQELARLCPPEVVNLRPGAFSALFAPLFGEFE